MKNLLQPINLLKVAFTFGLFFMVSSSYAQLKVVGPDGDVAIKNIASTPRAFLDINTHSSTKNVGQFGTFGIGSLNNTNGYLLGNGRYSGTKFQTYSAGGIGLLQFTAGRVIIYGSNSVGAESEATVTAGLTVSPNLVRVNGTTTFAGFNLYVSGNAYKSDGVATWTIASDANLKTNVRPYTKGLSDLMKVKTYSYEYNGKGGTQAGQKGVGILAQELKEIAPAMVSSYEYSEDPTTEEMFSGEGVATDRSAKEEYMTVNSSNFTYMLINAVKEQQATIKKLEERIKVLEQRTPKTNSGKVSRG